MGNQGPDAPPQPPGQHLFHSHTVRAATKQNPLMFCFSLMLCREKRNWSSLAILISQDVSLWTTSIFMVLLSPSVMREARWLASQFLQLLDSSRQSQDDEGLPSKSAWPPSLAKATEPVWRTDILRRVLHMEHIGYTNIGSFTWSETAPAHFRHILHSPIYI